MDASGRQRHPHGPAPTRHAVSVIPRLLLPLLLLGASAACSRWQMVRPLPAPEAGAVQISSARVTLRQNGDVVVLHDVQVTADSVIGWRAGDPDRSGLLSGSSRRMAVHRDQVLVLDRSVPDPVGIVAAATLATLLTVVFVALALAT